MHGSEMTIEERVIVFVDVHNYSMALDGLLESYGFLQEMYERLGDLVVGYGGEIIRYLGDAILSVFPAGTEHIPNLSQAYLTRRLNLGRYLRHHIIINRGSKDNGIAYFHDLVPPHQHIQ